MEWKVKIALFAYIIVILVTYFHYKKCVSRNILIITQSKKREKKVNVKSYC